MFCYKYVLSVYLLCLSCPSSGGAGKGRRMGGGGSTGRVLSQGGETSLHRKTRHLWPSSLYPILCALPDSQQAWTGYWQLGPILKRGRQSILKQVVDTVHSSGGMMPKRKKNTLPLLITEICIKPSSFPLTPDKWASPCPSLPSILGPSWIPVWNIRSSRGMSVS